MRDKCCLIKADEMSIGYKKVKKKAIMRVHVVTVALMERVHMEDRQQQQKGKSI